MTMLRSLYRRLGLGHLVLALAVFSLLAAFANTLYSAYRVQREILLTNALEANRVYAAKLADSTANFVRSAQQQLAVSASLLGARPFGRQALEDEAWRLLHQTDSFNSVLIVDARGTVLAVMPTTLNLAGKQLDSEGARAALDARQPRITQAYVSAAGNLVVNISQPILGKDGRYLGYVAGSIYLREKGILHALLGEHYYRDGSYLYVVDRAGRILYHPDNGRIGKVARDNPIVADVIAGKAGTRRIANSRNIDMLAGFAPVPVAGWGIVAQRPVAATLAEMDRLTLAVLRDTVPLVIASLLAAWYLAGLIAKPLRQLAQATGEKDTAATLRSIQGIRAWYFEARQLKQAVLEGLATLQAQIGALNEAAVTDPMTGLRNRRALSAQLRNWGAAAQPFAVIAIDVDRFKRVNDTYGHEAGDKVICHIARLMRECSRQGDFLCRAGGEEFLMLLPGCGAAEAMLIAERLRQRTAATPAPGVCAVTVSLGVASWPESHGSMERVLALADAALYAAKEQGRNRTVADASLDLPDAPRPPAPRSAG